jgi:hypothetical protein
LDEQPPTKVQKLEEDPPPTKVQELEADPPPTKAQKLEEDPPPTKVLHTEYPFLNPVYFTKDHSPDIQFHATDLAEQIHQKIILQVGSAPQEEKLLKYIKLIRQELWSSLANTEELKRKLNQFSKEENVPKFETKTDSKFNWRYQASVGELARYGVPAGKMKQILTTSAKLFGVKIIGDFACKQTHLNWIMMASFQTDVLSVKEIAMAGKCTLGIDDTSKNHQKFSNIVSYTPNNEVRLLSLTCTKKGENSWDKIIKHTSPWHQFILDSLKTIDDIHLETFDIFALVEATITDSGGDAPAFAKKIEEYVNTLDTTQKKSIYTYFCAMHRLQISCRWVADGLMAQTTGQSLETVRSLKQRFDDFKDGLQRVNSTTGHPLQQ